MIRTEFFKQIVDEYLFLDLKNMVEIQQKAGEPAGAASYPILATCVSAMELLGGLLSSEDYSDNQSKSKGYFEHYWNEYLIKVNPAYSRYLDLFWQLVRHGVAHTYIAKTAITVTKGKKDSHLVLYSDNTRFNIDCQVFYEDFLKSYNDQVKPLLVADNAFTKQVDKNIDLLLSGSEERSQKVLAPLVPTTRPSDDSKSDTWQTPSGIAPTTQTTTVVPDNIRQEFNEQQKLNITKDAQIRSGASMITQETAESLKNIKMITTKDSE
ncbi:MAG TPA: hypothetical protein VMQ52_01255 [Candidatus Saccharimonadales bacterium]|jgi:hypothetical protein|nr:hypothetical protein [Candidatus Saccharimonadales bacterium]